jgi:hypothetical protein
MLQATSHIFPSNDWIYKITKGKESNECVKDVVATQHTPTRRRKKKTERINSAIFNAPSDTHRGQPVNTNYGKGKVEKMQTPVFNPQ